MNNKKINALLKSYEERLKSAHVPTPKADATAIIAHVLCVDDDKLSTCLDKSLDKEGLEKAEAFVQRREKREPLARILGRVSFCGLDIKVTDEVSVPVSEIEELCAYAIDKLSPKKDQRLRILDIGTGTGCILLALLHELPKATGVGIDVSFSAVELAKQNAIANNLFDRSVFGIGNWNDALAEKFDLIICNPPAVPTNIISGLSPELRDHEPRAAIDGGSDGLIFFKEMAKLFEGMTKPDAMGIFHVHYLNRESSFFKKAGLWVDTKLNSRNEPCFITVTRNKNRKGWFQKLKNCFKK